MFDQSFSAANFEALFEIELRKGLVDFNQMPQEYRDAATNVKAVRAELTLLRKKKRAAWTQTEEEDYEFWREELKIRLADKEEALKKDMEALSEAANMSGFGFRLTSHMYGGKQYFEVDKADRVQHFAMKCLQRNLVNAFGVEMVSRHTVMANLKLMLNNNLPIYIIRTDIRHFFESIPQNRLMSLIERNSILSNKSKGLIKNIMAGYKGIKDKRLLAAGKGVPRGIGISSALSEIYLAELDKMIKGRKEVIFYVRYVDDIFMILSDMPYGFTLASYYQALEDQFHKYGLDLQPVGSGKCQLLDYYTPANGRSQNDSLTYLGYCLYLNKDARNRRRTKFGMSGERKQRFKSRVDNVFDRFKHELKYDIKQAKRDLKDGLNLITGNIRLSKAKEGVKVGFYYNNDLVDVDQDFDELEHYLHSKHVRVPGNLFADPADERAFVKKRRDFINSISLKDRWKEKKTFDIGVGRLKEIRKWL
jgi:hypothetical protein